MFGAKSRSSMFLSLALALILGIAAGAGLNLVEDLLADDRYPSGTIIADTDVSGLTLEQASRKLQNKTAIFKGVTYIFKQGKSSFSVSSDDLGAGLDLEAWLKEILKSEMQRPYLERLRNTNTRHYAFSVPIRYNRSAYGKVVKRMKLALERPPGNCKVHYDENGQPVIEPGTEGVSINAEETFMVLPTSYHGERVFQVPVGVTMVSPEVNPEQLVALNERASFITSFDPTNTNRTANLRQAASALDGVVVGPGQEFSFNAVVGPREISTGYKEAMVILQNVFTPGVGGGVCQVSSTLYNACLLANLKILERHNHSITVPYIPPGLDATVAYKIRDFRFLNNTGGPIVIKTAIGKSTLKITILGRPEPHETVKVERKVTSITDFKEIRKPDPTLPLGTLKVDHNGQKGYSVITYRVIYDENGREIKREMLARDVYKPLNKLILVGTNTNLNKAGSTEASPVPETPVGEPAGTGAGSTPASQPEPGQTPALTPEEEAANSGSQDAGSVQSPESQPASNSGEYDSHEIAVP